MKTGPSSDSNSHSNFLTDTQVLDSIKLSTQSVSSLVCGGVIMIFGAAPYWGNASLRTCLAALIMPSILALYVALKPMLPWTSDLYMMKIGLDTSELPETPLQRHLRKMYLSPQVRAIRAVSAGAGAVLCWITAAAAAAFGAHAIVISGRSLADLPLWAIAVLGIMPTGLTGAIGARQIALMGARHANAFLQGVGMRGGEDSA